MPKPPRRPPELRASVFRGTDVVARGLLTPTELRSGAWRALFRDVYADARLPVTHELRCTAAGRWLLPDGAAIAGHSAAALLHAWQAPADAPVEVVLRPGVRFGRARGMVTHSSASLAGADITRSQGIPVTSPLRTCWDLARWLDIVEAVAVIDAVLARRRLSPCDLREYALARAGIKGWQPLLRAACLADAGAESPPESRLRVRLVLAGLPAPVTQHVVRASGTFVARLDLAWPEHKVGVEYDGLWHGDTEQFHRDRRRLNALLAAGWIVLHATAPRLRDDFDQFAAEIRAALKCRTPGVRVPA